jgi:hypothetical protein
VPVARLECRTVSLVICFICIVALVLSFACDKVVLLRIVLILVAWELEMANNCSATVYKLSLVIWITSISFQNSHEPDNLIMKLIYLYRSILIIYCGISLYSANPSTTFKFKFKFFFIIKSRSNATCVGSSDFCIKLMQSKFTFIKTMTRENFCELFRFFPKGLMSLKIQTKFKSCLLLEFVIQNPFAFWIYSQKNSWSFLFILSPRKIW